MAENNIFRIYFEGDNAQEAIGAPSDPAPTDNPKPDKKNPTKTKSSAKQLVNLATIKQIGTTVFNSAASDVQMYTGSSTLQGQVNATISAVGTGVSIAANPALGMAMIAIDLATKAIKFNYEKSWNDKQVEVIRQRAGISFNRSRRSNL